jgi:predicted transcriptional regulator
MEQQATTFRLPKTLYERLREAAFRLHVPQVRIIEDALSAHLDELDKARAGSKAGPE